VLVDTHGANVLESFDARDRSAVAWKQRARPLDGLRCMRLLVLAVVTALAACTVADLHTHYPIVTPGQPTGTLVLLMSQPADDVIVTLDGVLVTSDAHTQRVVIDGVPVGTVDLIVAANGGDKEVKVWVGGDHATTVPIGIPDASVGFVKTMAGSLLTILVYSLLH
jgi:hypothetical protein